MSVSGTVGSGDHAYIGYDTLLANIVARDIIAYIFDEAVVAYGDVAQHGTTNTCVAREALVDLDGLVKYSERDFSIEIHVADILRRKIFRHGYACPVVGMASVLFEYRNLVYCKASHSFSYFIIKTRGC